MRRTNPVPDSRRVKVLRRDQYVCRYCGDGATQVDHIIPYTWAIHNEEANLVASCKRCNVIAGNMVFDSFEQKRIYILRRRSQLGERMSLADPIILDEDDLKPAKSKVKPTRTDGIKPKVFASLKNVRGPKDAREWLGIENYDLINELAVVLNEQSPNLGRSVIRWEKVGIGLPRILKGYSILMANHLCALTGCVEVGIAIQTDGLDWHVIPWRKCTCGQWFEIKRANQKHCRECNPDPLKPGSRRGALPEGVFAAHPTSNTAELFEYDKDAEYILWPGGKRTKADDVFP